MKQPHCHGSLALSVEDSPSASAPPSFDDLEALGDEIAGLAADLHAATYRLLVRLREFDARDGWCAGGLAGGFLSCAHWLCWRTGIDLGAAREKVRVARALAALPRIGRALETGELSYSKVRALTRIATPATEEELLELARHATASQVERVVRAWRRIDRAAAAEEGRRHEGRYLSVYADEDGSYVVRGRLDPEVGAMFQAALERTAMALLESEREAGRVVGGVSGDDRGAPAGVHRADGRGEVETDPEVQPFVAPPLSTAGQRRADALGALLERAVANGEEPCSIRGSRRVQVMMHVDGDALRSGAVHGQAVLDGGVRLSAETSRRLACDATKVSMTHDAGGTVLDVGRSTRTVPVAIRRALDARDRGCRFPGCTNRLTDAHHLRHWADGGATRLDNLLLLCRRHHRAVHEEGYRVQRTGGGGIVFRDPHGGLLPEVPPIPLHARPGEGGRVTATGSFDAANHRGIIPCPPFDRLDLRWAMRILYRPASAESARYQLSR